MHEIIYANVTGNSLKNILIRIVRSFHDIRNIRFDVSTACTTVTLPNLIVSFGMSIKMQSFKFQPIRYNHV